MTLGGSPPQLTEERLDLRLTRLGLPVCRDSRCPESGPGLCGGLDRPAAAPGGKEVSDKASSRERPNRDAATLPLEPHHSHFLLTSSGEEVHGAAAWGAAPQPPTPPTPPPPPHTPHHPRRARPSPTSPAGSEHELRRGIEERLQSVWKVPKCKLAVHGGRATFAAIVDALRSNCPVVVVRESGGAPARAPPRQRRCLRRAPPRASAPPP